MGDLRFWSANDRFGLVLPSKPLARLLRLCVARGDGETGGILIGNYTQAHDCALVSEVVPPPADSRSGHNWFERGVRGLDRRLAARWRDRREHYLGEWHYHPGGLPRPSGRDIQQMQTIARTDICLRPEPVLVILCGDAAGAWEVGAYVFPRGEAFVDLVPMAG